MADELRAAESDLYCSGVNCVIRLSLVSALGNPLLHPRGSIVDDRGV